MLSLIQSMTPRPKAQHRLDKMRTRRITGIKTENSVVLVLRLSDENPKKIMTSASWRSGYAADCKSVYTGSIPVLASSLFSDLDRNRLIHRFDVADF